MMPSEKRSLNEATVGASSVTNNYESFENPHKRAKHASIPTQDDSNENGVIIFDESEVYYGSNVNLHVDEAYGILEKINEAEALFDMRAVETVQNSAAPSSSWIPEAPASTEPIQDDDIEVIDVVVRQKPVYPAYNYDAPSSPLDTSGQIPSVRNFVSGPRRNTILVSSEALRDSTGQRITNQIEIKREDVQKVAPPTYFNDNLVLFFLNEALRSNPGIIDRTFVFDSLVFSKIVGSKFFNDDLRLSSTDAPELLKNCEFAQAWTKRVNLFSKDLILMTICHDEHWMLAVIVNPGNGIVEPSDSKKAPEADKFVRIYFMDPMGRCDARRNLRLALIVYALLKKQFEFFQATEGSPYHKDSLYRLSKLRIAIPKNLPIQPNFYDCGPFVCHFIQGVLDERRGFLARKDLDTLKVLDWNTVVPNSQQMAEYMRQTVLRCLKRHATSEESVIEMNKIVKQCLAKMRL